MAVTGQNPITINHPENVHADGRIQRREPYDSAKLSNQTFESEDLFNILFPAEINFAGSTLSREIVCKLLFKDFHQAISEHSLGNADLYRTVVFLLNASAEMNRDRLQGVSERDAHKPEYSSNSSIYQLCRLMDDRTSLIAGSIEKDLTVKLKILTNKPELQIPKNRINIQRICALCDFIENNSLFNPEMKHKLTEIFLEKLTSKKGSYDRKFESVIAVTMRELGAKLQIQTDNAPKPLTEKETDFRSLMQDVCKNHTVFKGEIDLKDAFRFAQLVVLLETEFNRLQFDSLMLISDALAMLENQSTPASNDDLKLITPAATVELGQFGVVSTYIYERLKGTDVLIEQDHTSEISAHILSGMSAEAASKYINSFKTKSRPQEKRFSDVMAEVLSAAGFKDARIEISKSRDSAVGVEWRIAWDLTSDIIKSLS